MKTTDYKIFKEKYGITEDIQLSCFNLITLPLPTPFITITDLNKLEFPALAYPIKQLVNYSKTIIDSNLERRAIGKSFNLLRLIELIAEHYNITAYHNFTHAFSVLQVQTLPFSSFTRPTIDLRPYDAASLKNSGFIPSLLRWHMISIILARPMHSRSRRRVNLRWRRVMKAYWRRCT